MDFETVKQKLFISIQQIFERDAHLLHNDINEPCISHRLALYLGEAFAEFDVDCEYNGNIDADTGRKYVYLLKQTAEQLGITKNCQLDGDLMSRCVYPDIIVHKRGMNSSGNNILVIEVKKSSNPQDGKWDREKLARFTSKEYQNNFDYDYGAFIRFAVGKEIGYSLEWYINGTLIDSI